MVKQQIWARAAPQHTNALSNAVSHTAAPFDHMVTRHCYKTLYNCNFLLWSLPNAHETKNASDTKEVIAIILL